MGDAGDARVRSLGDARGIELVVGGRFGCSS